MPGYPCCCGLQTCAQCFAPDAPTDFEMEVTLPGIGVYICEYDSTPPSEFEDADCLWHANSESGTACDPDEIWVVHDDTGWYVIVESGDGFSSARYQSEKFSTCEAMFAASLTFTRVSGSIDPCSDPFSGSVEAISA